jgi:hypothetical protein
MHSGRGMTRKKKKQPALRRSLSEGAHQQSIQAAAEKLFEEWRKRTEREDSLAAHKADDDVDDLAGANGTRGEEALRLVKQYAQELLTLDIDGASYFREARDAMDVMALERVRYKDYCEDSYQRLEYIYEDMHAHACSAMLYVYARTQGIEERISKCQDYTSKEIARIEVQALRDHKKAMEEHSKAAGIEQDRYELAAIAKGKARMMRKSFADARRPVGEAA